MKYKPKTPMRGYQARALKKFVGNRGIIALHMPMRSGKTKTSIDCIACARQLWGRPKRVLVICPMSVIGVWVNELRKHCPVNFRAITRYGETTVLDRSDKYGIQFLIVNYEALYDREDVVVKNQKMRVNHDSQKIKDFNPDALIVDEATALGDPTTVQSKKAFKITQDHNIPIRIIMTGTPWHRRLLKAFGAWKVLNPEVFGTNWTAYKKTYGLWGGYAGTKLLKYINLKQFRKKVAPWAFTMKFVPKMKPVHQVIPIQLNEGRDEYKQMATEAYLEVKGHEIAAELVISRLRKLCQLANGYIRSDEQVLRVGADKEKFATRYLSDLEDQGVHKLVLVCEEYPQLASAAKAARKAGYKTILFYGGTVDRDYRIHKFQTTKDKVCMVMQISTGSMGIDLSAASVMGFWSPPENLLHWDQVCARIRVHDDPRTLFYFYLVMKGTVEEARYLALQQNVSLVRLVEDHPQLISYQEQG